MSEVVPLEPRRAKYSRSHLRNELMVIAQAIAKFADTVEKSDLNLKDRAVVLQALSQSTYSLQQVVRVIAHAAPSEPP